MTSAKLITIMQHYRGDECFKGANCKMMNIIQKLSKAEGLEFRLNNKTQHRLSSGGTWIHMLKILHGKETF